MNESNSEEERYPANFIFLEKEKIEDVKQLLYSEGQYFSIGKYRAEKCNSAMFYKPISRTFKKSVLYGQER